jgi:hypothetical protein
MKVKCDSLWGLKYIPTITRRHKQNTLETSDSQNMTAGADISNGYNLLCKALIVYIGTKPITFLCPRIIL